MSRYVAPVDQLRELYRYRELLRRMVGASLKTEYHGTVFGAVWWLIDPLLQMLVYTFLVAVVFGRGGPEYPLFVLAALISWKWFAAGVQGAIAQTLGNERLMKQVPFPREVLPLGAVLSQSFSFLSGLAVLIAAAALLGTYPHPVLLALPVVILAQLAFTLGVALILSTASVFFRDVRNLASHGLRIWFYLSPGLYAVRSVPDAFRGVYELNPFAVFLPAYRTIVLDHALPELASLLWVTAVSVITLVLGYAVFAWQAPRFAKVL